METKHPIPPLYTAQSTVLILGSFPSVKSREEAFFYGHRQNRFWKVLARVFKKDAPQTITQKRDFLLSHHIALWDVIASCEIVGSSDSSIKNVIPNDLSIILDSAPIRQIFVNGKTAEKWYNRCIKAQINQTAICLPSTSPANAAWTLERLTEEWKYIRV